MRTPIPLDNENKLIEYWSKTGLLEAANNAGFLARCFEVATAYILAHEEELSTILTIILPLICRLLSQHDGASNEHIEKYIHKLIPDIKEEFDKFPKSYGVDNEAEFCIYFDDIYEKNI